MLSCSGPQKLTRTDETAPLYKLLEEYYHYFSERDWDKYESYFWSEATLTTVWQDDGMDAPGVVITSIEEFLGKTHLGPDSQPIFEEKMNDAFVAVRGDLAQAWVKYEAKFGNDNELMQWEGIDLFSFMKHNGEWRIVSIVYSSNEEL